MDEMGEGLESVRMVIKISVCNIICNIIIYSYLA